MKIFNVRKWLAAIAIVTGLWLPVSIHAQSDESIVVRVDQPVAPIQPTMWGIFFEDINLGADGGLYAELVKNRSFEFPEAMMGWNKINSGVETGVVDIRNA